MKVSVFYLTLLAILFLCEKHSLSQSLDFKKFPGSFNVSAPGKIIHQDPNTVYFLSTETSGTTGSESLYINSLSKDGKFKSEKFKLPKTALGAKEKNAEFFSFNNKIYAFVSGVDKGSDSRKFYAVEIDPSTLLSKSEVKVLLSVKKIDIGIFSNQLFTCIFSPDKKKMAVWLQENYKDEYASSQCVILNEDLNPIERFEIDKEVITNFQRTLYNQPSDHYLLAYDLYNTSIKQEIMRIYLNNQGELFFAISGDKRQNYQIAKVGKDKTVQLIELNSKKLLLRNMFSQQIGNYLFVKSEMIDANGSQIGMYVAKINLDTKKVEYEHQEKFSQEFQGQYYDELYSAILKINKTATLGMVQSNSGRLFIFDQKVWTSRDSDNSIDYFTGELFITCIGQDGKLIYRQKLLKQGQSSLFDRLAFIPILDGDKLHVLFQDHENNLVSWTSGTIQTPGLKNNVILADAIFEPDGTQKRINTNLYDQKTRLFIRTDHSIFMNNKSALLMLFNRNSGVGTFVSVNVQ